MYRVQGLVYRCLVILLAVIVWSAAFTPPVIVFGSDSEVVEPEYVNGYDVYDADEDYYDYEDDADYYDDEDDDGYADVDEEDKGIRLADVYIGDVLVINSIITYNLLGFSVVDLDSDEYLPGDWDFAEWADGRVVRLRLSGLSLEGHLDVSGLGGLLVLDVRDNRLESVEVGAGLVWLDVRYNLMDEVCDVIGFYGGSKFFWPQVNLVEVPEDDEGADEPVEPYVPEVPYVPEIPGVPEIPDVDEDVDTDIDTDMDADEDREADEELPTWFEIINLPGRQEVLEVPETPIVSEVPAELPRLSAPVGLLICDDGVFSWDVVEGAAAYGVYVDGRLKVRIEQSLQSWFFIPVEISEVDLGGFLLPAGAYEVQVRAIGDGVGFEDSELSSVVIYEVGGVGIAAAFGDIVAFGAPMVVLPVLHSGAFLDNIMDDIDGAPWRIYSCWTLVVDSGFIQNLSLNSPWSAHSSIISSIYFTGPMTAGIGLSGLFSGLSNVTYIEGLHYFDISNVTSLGSMFSGASVLINLNLSSWDTSSVTDMNAMFWSADLLTTLNLSSWDTSGVTDMGGMFFNARSLQTLDLSSWDTSRVTDMGLMFSGASSLATLNLASWDTSSVTRMTGMFLGASSLTALDISSWDTSSVIFMNSMFSEASSLTSLNIFSWDTSSVTDMGLMFSGATNLRELTLGSNFQFRGTAANTLPAVPNNATHTGYWTNGNLRFTSAQLITNPTGLADTWVWEQRGGGGVDATCGDNNCSCATCTCTPVTSVTDTFGVGGAPWRLYGCGTLVVDGGIVHTNWTNPWSAHSSDILDIIFTDSITAGASLAGLFSLPYVRSIVGLEHFDTSSVTDMEGMFNGASSITSLDISSWDTGNVVNMEAMFSGLGSTGSLTSLNISTWDTGNVTNMDSMFSGARALTSLDLSSWDTSSVTSMNEMFGWASALTSLDLSSWDTSSVTSMNGMFREASSLTSLDLSSWDTSNVTRMVQMFLGASALTSLDLSSWDTSNVTNMVGMFWGASALTSLDLSSWDTSSVTSMWSMFSGTSALTSLDISSWDTSNVTSMGGMFSGTRALTSLDLPSWDTSSVATMGSMFSGASALTSLDLSSWDTSSVTSMGSMFSGASALTSLDLSSWDTSNVTSMEGMFWNTTNLRELTLGSNFQFRGTAANTLPAVPNNATHTGYWTNSTLRFTSAQLITNPTGLADTWVWETTLQPTIITYNAPTGIEAAAYSFQFEATGRPTPTWTHTGTLPTGLTLNNAGLLSGTPSTVGSYTFTVTVTNSTGTDSRTITIVITNQPTAPTITIYNAHDAQVGDTYSFQLVAVAYPVATWSHTGILPVGLTLNPTGLLSGTPSTAGSFTFTVTATNTEGSDSQVITIIISDLPEAPEITTVTVPNGIVGTSYSLQFPTLGNPIPTWSYTGTLPTGLSLSNTGLLSGTPTASGSFTFTVVATNTEGTDSLTVTIVISFTPEIPTIVTYNAPDGIEDEAYSFQFVAEGYPTPTWTYTGTLPDGLVLSSNGLLSGTPTEYGNFTFTVTATNTEGTDSRTITIEIDEQQPSTMTVTINEGGINATVTGGANHVPGSTVTIFAGERYGYNFVNWTSSPSVSFADATDSTTSFVMPASNVVVTPIWAAPHTTDIAVINNIINQNGLDAPLATGNTIPADWSTFSTWQPRTTNPTYLRITALDLNNQGLTGELDVHELEFLTYLNVYNNNLTLIELTGLSNLRYLNARGNQLRGILNLRETNALRRVYLYGNTNISRVDVNGLSDLAFLNVGATRIQNRDSIPGLMSSTVVYPNFPINGEEDDTNNAGIDMDVPRENNVSQPNIPTTNGAGGGDGDGDSSGDSGSGSGGGSGASTRNQASANNNQPVGDTDRLTDTDYYTPSPEALSNDALDQITDSASAVLAVERALEYLLQDGPLTDAELTQLALFAELAIAQAASYHTDTNYIIVNQPNVEYLQNISSYTRISILELLGERGYEFNRYLDESVAFITTDYAQVNILVEPSAMFTDVDRVWIRTPYYDVSFTQSFIQNNAHTPLSIYVSSYAEDLLELPGTQVLMAEVDFELISRLVQVDGGVFAPRSYTVTFSRPVTESVRLSVPPIDGDPAYQTLMSAAGVNAGGNHNQLTGMLDARIRQNGSYTVVENRIDFADIQNRSQEMQRAIRTLASKGIISGMSANEFAPDDPLTRAQVATLITLILGVHDPNADGGFTDVNRSDWFFGAVGTARQHGLMSGTSSTAFSPNMNIPRDQMIAIAARILRTEMNYRDPVVPMSYLREFVDAGDFADWSVIDLSLATRENLVIRRVDGQFMPRATITRGEAAVILYRLYRRIW